MITVKFPSTENPSFYMDIPRGYNFSGSQGDSNVEHKYIYPDSSIIFITNFKNSPNYEILRKNDLYDQKFNTIIFSTDTLVLKGVDNKRYWKDITYDEISIGYRDVPKGKKKKFDEAIKTFRSES